MYVDAKGDFIIGDVVDDKRKGVSFEPCVGGGFVVGVFKCLVGCGDVAIKCFDIFEVWVVVGQDGVHVYAGAVGRPGDGWACDVCGAHVCFQHVHFVFVDGAVADVVAGLVEVHHRLVE